MSNTAKFNWAVILILVTTALALPGVFISGAGNDFDESHYHYPAVLQIRDHWPRLDLVRDSLSPIAPGYHYFLATCSFVTGPSLLAMRLLTLLISIPIVVLLFLWLAKYVQPHLAFMLALPFAANCFFLKASCRVVTDNAALLLSTLTLMTVFLLPARGRIGSLGGISASLATFTRQLTVTLVLVLWLQTALEKFRRISDDPSGDSSRKATLGSLAVSFAFRSMPLVVLAVLVHAWGGLVAPQWQHISSTLSAAASAYLLSLAALIGIPFVLVAWPNLDSRAVLWKKRHLGVATIGLGIAAVSPNDWAPQLGRWGGWLWEFVRHSPHPYDRSILLLILAPLGTCTLSFVTLAIWNKGLHRSAVLWLSSFLAWTSSYALSTNVYHHYFEPQLLIFFAVACGLLLRDNAKPVLMWWPLVLFLGYDFVLDFVEIFRLIGTKST